MRIFITILFIFVIGTFTYEQVVLAEDVVNPDTGDVAGDAGDTGDEEDVSGDSDNECEDGDESCPQECENGEEEDGSCACAENEIRGDDGECRKVECPADVGEEAYTGSQEQMLIQADETEAEWGLECRCFRGDITPGFEDADPKCLAEDGSPEEALESVLDQLTVGDDGVIYDPDGNPVDPTKLDVPINEVGEWIEDQLPPADPWQDITDSDTTADPNEPSDQYPNGAPPEAYVQTVNPNLEGAEREAVERVLAAQNALDQASADAVAIEALLANPALTSEERAALDTNLKQAIVNKYWAGVEVSNAMNELNANFGVNPVEAANDDWLWERFRLTDDDNIRTKVSLATADQLGFLRPEWSGEAGAQKLYDILQNRPGEFGDISDYLIDGAIITDNDLKSYAIGGMDPDFKTNLTALGRDMENAGIPFEMNAGYRSNFQQIIATCPPWSPNCKADPGTSFHGNEPATAGYGDGQAVDIVGTNAQNFALDKGHMYNIANPKDWDEPHFGPADGTETFEDNPAAYQSPEDAIATTKHQITILERILNGEYFGNIGSRFAPATSLRPQPRPNDATDQLETLVSGGYDDTINNIVNLFSGEN